MRSMGGPIFWGHSTYHQKPAIRMAQQSAVQSREAGGVNFPREFENHAALFLGAKLHREEFPLPHAKTVGHVVLGHDEVMACVVLPPNDDVRTGMARVVVINCHPIELGFQVAFNLGHEVTYEGFEVSEFHPIIGRYNQPKLVAITFAVVEEGGAIGFVSFRSTELTRFSLQRHTIALDIAEVSTGGSLIIGFRF